MNKKCTCPLKCKIINLLCFIGFTRFTGCICCTGFSLNWFLRLFVFILLGIPLNWYSPLLDFHLTGFPLLNLFPLLVSPSLKQISAFTDYPLYWFTPLLVFPFTGLPLYWFSPFFFLFFLVVTGFPRIGFPLDCFPPLLVFLSTGFSLHFIFSRTSFPSKGFHCYWLFP